MVGIREPAALKRAAFFAWGRSLPSRYWLIVLLGSVFTLARFSEAFLVLRAQSVGLSLGFVPLIMIVMNIFYAASAYPAGVVSDRISPRLLLILGLAVLVAADIILAAADAPLAALAGAAFWGLHMGLTQGLFAKLVADTAPAALRGTAFGIFNLAGGVALLLASAIAGILWSAFGPKAAFLTCAGFAAVALIGLIVYRGTARTKRSRDAGRH